MAEKPGEVQVRIFSKGDIPLRTFIYITKEYLLSFFVAFIFFFVVFLINQILLMAEDILSRHAPVGQVALLLLFSLPSVIAISFPFSTLAGALMSSARLSSDNEIQAFSAGGISALQLLTPFLVLGLAISIISFFANDYFLPHGSVEFGKVYAKLVRDSAAVEFTPWSVKKFPEATIVTGPEKDGKIEHLVVFDTADAEGQRVLYAASASIDVLPGAYDAVLDLNSVWEQRLDPKKKYRFSISNAQNVRYKIVLREKMAGYQGMGPSEMSSSQIFGTIRSKTSALDSRKQEQVREEISARESLAFNYAKAASADGNAIQQGGMKSFDEIMSHDIETLSNLQAQLIADRSLQVYKLEYNKKFAIPFAGFFFSFLAFPLGLGSKKAGRTAGFGIALLISVIYWGLLFAGQTFGVRSGLNPFLAIWSPDIVVFGVAVLVWKIRRTSKRRVV